MKNLVTVVLILTMANFVFASTSFDGDYSADIFVSNSTGVYWYEGGNAGALNLTSQIYSGSNQYGIAVGKFDADNASDFFITKNDTSGEWWSATGINNGISQTSNEFGGAAKVVSVGDFDSDGKGDVAWTKTGGYQDWYESTGDGTYRWVNAIMSSGALGGYFGDLDGDGKTDLFEAKSTMVTWYEGNGTNDSFGWAKNGWSGNVKSITIGNFDGDALADMFVVRADGGLSWFEAKVGDNLIPTWLGDNLASGLTCATLGDVNGDGKQELLGGTSNGITWFGSTADNVISQIGTSNEGQDIRSIAIAEIPEPATIFLLGLGATALLRKKK